MTDLAALYHDLILDHHRSPRNSGRLADATHAGDASNPLCGDRTRLTLRIEGGTVLDARCEVQGCAICRASSSMLTEAVIGRDVGEASALAEQFLGMIQGMVGGADDGADQSRDAALGPLAAFGQVRHFPSRARCATLSWEVLQRTLAG